ncbi:histidine kinase [Bacillus sp. SA1-12]|uniref:sensor histidine kinase n=1 Tax=Bacillus sp. SA1-12 TaxID=1455638 RepID=UPI0006273989|nr:HAMP domain-containing sensor histidine kinase [Bacillus sp. SA1-12]KKI89261.1 histidine kinase [Bacillus sp. SA1-12]
MRLRNKINLYTAVLFSCLLIVMNVSIYLVFSKMMISNEIERSKSEAAMVAKNVSRDVTNIADPGNLLRAYVPVDGMLQIVFEQDKPTTVTSQTEQDLRGRKATFYPGEKSDLITFQKKQYVFTSNPIIWKNGSIVNLQFTRSIERTEEMLAILRVVLLAVTFIAMIPVLVSTSLLSNLITRPIRSMIDTMKDIQNSGQFKRLNLKGKSKDELVEMGNTFNHMIDLLEANFEKQEQFVSNASHELKTPLTIIESYADLLKRRGKKQPDLFDESIEAIHSEAVRMRDMTEQLLLLAKHQAQWNIKLENLNLNDLVSESAKVFQNAYQRQIDIHGKEQINVTTDQQKLKQLLFIFLDNARKYSDDEIAVYIGRTSEKDAYIRIEDRGIGIPKQDLPKVFDRFYRVDKARSRKQGGSGLGLSVANEIAKAINIRLEMDSLEGRGTTATLFLPLS